MPTIISDGGSATANISLAEDRRGVTRVVATDPNPGPITYSIVGGPDQALFAINATTGLLWLVQLPAFSEPAGSNHPHACDVHLPPPTSTRPVTIAIAV